MSPAWSDPQDTFDRVAGIERRRHARKRLSGHTVVLLVPQREVRVRPLDIGVGGMGIVVPVEPPAGTRFRIRTELPLGLRAVTIEAGVEVTYAALSGPYGGFKTGLRFVDLDPQLRSHIVEFLQA